MTEIYVPDKLLFVIDALAEKGFEGYLVGGCVRDRVMGKTPNDYDVTTSSLPEETKEVFKNHRVIETGIKHGTVTVLVEDEPIEITTFRIDGEYKDNRHPESVSFTRDIESDLARRDFTVNAMAYNPRLGFVDPFDGTGDIKRKLIRCVGNPDKRFNEDGLRILRGLRFASTLGFDIEKDTSDSIKKNAALLKGIAGERIYTELKKLLCGCNAEHILKEYTDVLEVFAKGVESEKTAEIVGRVNCDVTTRLAAWLSSCGADAADEVMMSLKSDRKTREDVVALVEMLALPHCADRFFVKRMYARYGKEFCKSYASIAKVIDGDFDTDAFLSELKSFIENDVCIKITQLDINGKELSELGVPSGRETGRILSKLYELVFMEKVPNRKDLLVEYAKKFIGNGGEEP